MHNLDTSILLLINGANTPLLDSIFWWITSDNFTFLSVAIASIAVIAVRGVQTFIVFFILGLVAVIIGDAIITHIFKPGIGRLRPSHNPELMGLLHIVNDYRGGRYGFYSAHASNSAVIASLTIVFLRLKDRIGAGYLASLRDSSWLLIVSVLTGIYIVLYSFLFGLSRIYLGVHYPSDVLVGWTAGIIIAVVAYRVLLLVQANLTKWMDRLRT